MDDVGKEEKLAACIEALELVIAWQHGKRKFGHERRLTWPVCLRKCYEALALCQKEEA